MENKKSAIDEFLGETNEKSDDFIKNEPSEFLNPKEEEKTEEPEKDSEDKAEKPEPFHKDPKVQRYVQKQIEKALKDLKPSETRQFIEDTKSEDPNDLVEAFTAIIGNDTPEKVRALKMLEKSLSAVEEKASQKALSQMEAERQRIQQEEEEAVEELMQGLENIEESYDVDLTSNTQTAKKLRGEFVDFISRIAPKNSNGDVVAYPDLDEAYKMFKEKKSASSSQNTRAKDLAARSISRSGDASNTPTTTDKSWRGIDKIFAKLNK